MRVVLTGAHGLVGRAVRADLLARGHHVVTVTRTLNGRAFGDVLFDPTSGWIEGDKLEGFDAVIHLGGWAKLYWRRWTAARRSDILRSRIDRTRTIATALAALDRPPRVLVSESWVAYYGNRGDEVLTESSRRGDTFLARVGEEWEAAAALAAPAGIRVVTLRLGEVLAADGGPLARHLRRFRAGLGGRLGSGRQWVSWISLDDVLGTIRHVIDDESINGPVNATAPHPVTNAEYTRAIARTVRRPALLPAPALACRAVLGTGLATEALLASQRAIPAELDATGYRWLDPDLDATLAKMVTGAVSPRSG